MEAQHLVEIKNVTKYFPITKGIVRQRKVADIKAVNGVSFFIRGKETWALSERVAAARQPWPGAFCSFIVRRREKCCLRERI